MSGAVVYRPSGDNLLLRRALWEEWGYRCYWCKKPKDLLSVEIDHMIPQALSRKESDGLLVDLLSPQYRIAPFKMHAPHNLAPICGLCNNEKKSEVFLDTPRFMSLLRQAIKREQRVVERVLKFRKGNTFSKAMVTVTGIDESNLDAMAALAELGPIFVNRLRYIAPDILQGPSNYDFANPMFTEMHRVAVTLDEAARRARIVLEDGYGCAFDAVLTEVSGAVTRAIQDRLAAVIAAELAGQGYDPDVGTPEGWVDIAITSLAQEPGAQIFECGGTYEADGATFAAIQDPRSDSGTDWVQREADVEGRFTVQFWIDEAPSISVGDVEWVELVQLPGFRQL